VKQSEWKTSKGLSISNQPTNQHSEFWGENLLLKYRFSLLYICYT
jgi:hypothetical protein